jgi:hypothetical protein
LDTNVSTIQHDLFQLELTEDAHIDATDSHAYHRSHRPYQKHKPSHIRQPYTSAPNRPFAAFREAYLLEMEKDEKDDDNNPVVWVQRIGEDHSNASQKVQYTMPLRETMSGVAGTMISTFKKQGRDQEGCEQTFKQLHCV